MPRSHASRPCHERLRAVTALFALAAACVLLSAACAGAALAAGHGAHPRGHRHACTHTSRRAHTTHHRCRAAARRSRSARRAQQRAARAMRSQLAARERASAIAAALAEPCPNTELQPQAGNEQAVNEAVLCLINLERAQHEELPLRLNADLQAAAQAHCAEMVAEDYFEHVSPSGLTPAQRIREDGYIPSPDDGYVIGENLAWGTFGLATPQAIVAAWVASPPHLANILETRYTETGLAVVASVPPSLAAGAPGATYAEEFGVVVAG